MAPFLAYRKDKFLSISATDEDTAVKVSPRQKEITIL